MGMKIGSAEIGWKNFFPLGSKAFGKTINQKIKFLEYVPLVRRLTC